MQKIDEMIGLIAALCYLYLLTLVALVVHFTIEYLKGK